MTLSASALAAIANATVNGIELCDAVSIPRGRLGLQLAKFFLLIDATARHAGVYVRVHENLADLVAVNARLRESWGPLVPTLDPQHSHLTPETSFWVSAHGLADDQLVGVCAARRFEPGQGGLTDEFRSLRIFYRDPENELAKGTRCTVEGAAVEETAKVQGVSVYTGGQWTDPAHRGKGIVYILGRVARNLALARWDPVAAFGVARANLAGLGVIDRYGFTENFPLIKMTGSYRGDFDMHFLWMGRLRILELLLRHCGEMEENIARVAVAQESNISPERLQGKISRS